MDKYSVADIITASVEGKPLDVNKFFYDLMADRTQEYVDSKREEIAQTMFNSEDEVEYEEKDEVEVDEVDEDEVELEDDDVDIEVVEIEDEEFEDEETEEDGEDA